VHNSLGRTSSSVGSRASASTAAACRRSRFEWPNVLPYTVLKISAFQDRHENKDAYDLLCCSRSSTTRVGLGLLDVPRRQAESPRMPR
jgi:hypothetical protein